MSTRLPGYVGRVGSVAAAPGGDLDELGELEGGLDGAEGRLCVC
jgi:hypothetical protein